jgi:hypothetical protein
VLERLLQYKEAQVHALELQKQVGRWGLGGQQAPGGLPSCGSWVCGGMSGD